MSLTVFAGHPKQRRSEMYGKATFLLKSVCPTQKRRTQEESAAWRTYTLNEHGLWHGPLGANFCLALLVACCHVDNAKLAPNVQALMDVAVPANNSMLCVSMSCKKEQGRHCVHDTELPSVLEC
eukprot:368857-Pelagomonas_calceolata.AAC.14